jgi:hypothetical protein
MPFSTSGKPAFVGDRTFSKETTEYSDLMAMFSHGTIDSTVSPSDFYNDPKNKPKYGKFNYESFKRSWYRAKQDAPLPGMEFGTHCLIAFVVVFV